MTEPQTGPAWLMPEQPYFSPRDPETIIDPATWAPSLASFFDEQVETVAAILAERSITDRTIAHAVVRALWKWDPDDWRPPYKAQD